VRNSRWLRAASLTSTLTAAQSDPSRCVARDMSCSTSTSALMAPVHRGRFGRCEQLMYHRRAHVVQTLDQHRPVAQGSHHSHYTPGPARASTADRPRAASGTGPERVAKSDENLPAYGAAAGGA
jgi:hypothetical protein